MATRAAGRRRRGEYR